MANAILAYDDFVDRAASITASDQVVTLPALNLGHPFISPNVWRTNGNSAFVDVDFGLSRAVDVIAMLGCNLLPATATWSIILSDSASFTPALYSSGTVATGIDTFYDSIIHVLPTQTAARYLRVSIADTALSFLQIGRLFAATGWRMTRNYAWGLRERWDDTSRQSKAESGQIWVDRGVTHRAMSFQLNAVTEIETRSHVARLGRIARARDVLFITDPSSVNLGRDSIFGLLENVPEPRYDRFGYHSLSFTILERL